MWNFQGKFLISRDGKVIKRLHGHSKDLAPQIEKFMEETVGLSAAGANSHPVMQGMDSSVFSVQRTPQQDI